MPSFHQESAIDELVASYIHHPKHLASVISNFAHRQALVKQWSPEKGSQLLDIGCGQGESSLVLAQTVGPSGHVIGIDTACPDYGGPFTVSQSQKYIQESALGTQINFQRIDAATLLLQKRGVEPQRCFDAAVLCHSLWYFTNTEHINALFRTLAAAKIPKLYLAEYSFQASIPAQIPHVLAAQAQKRLTDLQRPYTYSGVCERNIRTALLPEELICLAQYSGWSVGRQGIITPGADLMDGHREATYVLMDHFAKEIMKYSLDEEDEKEVFGFVPKVKKAIAEVESSGIKTMQTMDVWWAVLELDI